MDAAQMIDHFLQLNEDRKIVEAQAMFAADCIIEFPGGKNFRSLADMVENAKGRYNWIKKHRDQYFVGENGDLTTVTSIGTLYGENLQGVAFEGIRYVDVFVIKNGLIIEQRVWNDLAETGVLNRS